MEERVDLLELDIDLWLPFKLKGRGRLNEFIWDILHETPDLFHQQMDALVASGGELVRKGALLGMECGENDFGERYRIANLCINVQEVVARITMRQDLAKHGFARRFPAFVICDSQMK